MLTEGRKHDALTAGNDQLTRLGMPKAEKCTASTEVESVETVALTTSHNNVHHTRRNAPYAEVRDTEQDAAEKQNT